MILKPLLALILTTSLAQAGDWPQFRGPNANGIADETGLPVQLDRSCVSWSGELPGRGLSSPIIIGHRVFVTCASGPKQDRLHVICFNAETGQRIWERHFWATGRTMCHEKTSVAAPTPASDGERIYAIFSSNDLVCLDLEGNLIWLRGLTVDYPNASNSLGMSSSLVVVDGVLVAMVENDSESFSAAFNPTTGVNLWKLDRPKMANWTSPFVVTFADDKRLVGLQSGRGISGVEPKTGRVIWEYTEGASTIPSSTFCDGVLYASSHGITALRAESDGKSLKQIWRSGQLRPGTASPVVLADRIFTLNDGGVLTCASTLDGKRLWQLRLKGPFSATPVAAGSWLYCVNEKGIVQVVDTKAAEGAVVGELDLGATILSTPSISRGGLYLRSDGNLWKLVRARPKEA